MHDDDEYDDDDDLFSPPPMMMQNKRMESMNLEDGRHHGGGGGGGLRRISLPIYSAHGIVTKEQKSLRRVSTSAAEIQQQQQQQHSNNKQRQRRTRSVQLKNGLIHEEEETQQQQQQQDDDGDALPSSPPAKKHDDQHLLGMIHGVYVPVLENMWGVLIFLRFFYIVGNAGVFETLGIVAISFFAALLTTFSLSAIATNGPIDHGGAYFIISRAVGPRVGAAIGLVYFLGVSLLAVLEALGAVEMLLFTAPVLSFTSANRAWGSIFIALLFTMVYAGVRMVAKFGILFAIIVVLTLISYYVGLGVAPNARAPCEVTGLQWSTLQGNLYPAYNTEQSFATMLTLFFPCFTGFLSGANRSMSLKDPTKAIPRGTIAAVVTSLVVYTSFFMLWASVAPRQYLTWGSTTRNDLWPGSQGRYPEGTTRADVCPNLSEDSLAFAPAPGGDFVDVFDDAYFGVRRLARRLLASAGSSDSLYVITDIVWPLPIVTQIGVIIASLAQAMQCLVVSPRMLQAIAQDGTIPVLKPLRVMGGKFNDEPRRALICTGIICLLGVQIGKLDPVAPMLSVCFLVCYSALNLSTAIHSYTHSPDWRPTFPIRHWSVSMLGFLLCAALAFVINWMYSLILMFAVLVISVYVAWCDVAVSWGTGFGGLQLKLALRWATHRQHQLHTTGTHISQWRPQLLIIRRPDETRTALRKQRLLEVAYQLKHGGGLTCLASIMEGDATDPDSRAMLAKVKRNLERELYLIREEETSSYSPFVRSGPKNDNNYNDGGGNDDGDDDDDDERRRTTHRVVDMTTMSDDAAPSSCCDDDDDDMKDVEEERRRTCCHRPSSWCSWCNFDIRHCCRAWLQRSRTGVRKTIQMGGGKKQRVVKIAGFVQAVIVADWRVGLTAALQAIGLGALEPNMVLTSLSTTAAASSGGGGGGGGNGDGGDHTPSSGGADGKIHLGSLLRISANVGKVACVVHSLGAWPTNARQLSEEWKTSRRDISGDDDGVGPSSETIDVWWVNHDGGLLLLLAHLLRRDNVWRKCKLRVFCIVNAVTDPEQNEAFTNAMKKELDDSRIKADTVTVVSLAREECFAILHDVDRASSCVSEFGSDDDDEDYQRLGTINEMMIPTTAAAAADESGGGGGGGGAQPTNRESCVSITASRGGGGGGGGDTQRRVTSTAVNLNLLSSCRTMRDTSLSRRMSTLLRTLIAQSSARQRSSSSTGEARTTTCDDAAPSSPIDDSDDAGVSGGDGDEDNDAHVPFHVQATTLHQAIQRHSRRASLVLINLPGPSMALRDDPTGSSSSPPQSDAKETDLAYVQFMETVVGMGTGQQPLRRAMLVHGTGQEHISNIS